MAAFSTIRFPRANIVQSGRSDDFSTIMNNSSLSLPYGSPLIYSYDAWHQDSYTKYNHMFVNGVDGNSNDWFHVGPYWGSVGVDVNNNPDSTNLGKIELKLTAGTGITLTDDTTTGYKTIATTAASEDVYVCHYNSGTGVMDKTYNEIITAAAAGKVVLCHETNNADVKYNRVFYLVHRSDTTTFRLLRFFTIDQLDNCVIYLIPNGTIMSGTTWFESSVGIYSSQFDRYTTTDGQTSFSTYVALYANVSRRVIIDNRNNSNAVTVTFTTSAADYVYDSTVFTNDANWATVAADSISSYKVSSLSDGNIYIECQKNVIAQTLPNQISDDTGHDET